MSDTPTNNGDDAVDIGGLSIKRSALVEVLPDLERFERHRADALAIDAAMSANDGSVPEYVNEWPQERIEAVVATLKELGNLRAEVQKQISQQQTDSTTKDRPVSQLFRHGGGDS